MSETKLTLQEQLLLLCVHPRTGDVHQPHFRYLLSGAALAELLRQKRLEVELNRVKVRQTQPLGDRAIDDVFVRFGTTSRSKPLSWWISHLYNSQSEPLRVLGERLTERGILTASDHRALWVVRWTTYPVLEPAYVEKLHKQVHAAISGDGSVDPELAILISLLHNGKALDKVLSATERMEREQRIAQITASDPIAYAVGKALADALLEEEIERKRNHYHGSPPIVIVRPPRHGKPRHPRRPRRPWETTFPGDAPTDEHGAWLVEEEDETSAPV